MDGFPIQTNFTSGEVSPLLLGRVDTQKYFNGAQKIENFIVKPQGGIIRRSGTRFVKEVKDSTKLTILFDFRFSNNDAIIIEFGEHYCRFYQNGARIESPPGTPVEVVTEYDEDELRQLYFAQSGDVLWITHPNHPPATLSRFSNTNWVLNDFTTIDGPYLDTDTRGYQMSLSAITNRATIKSTANDFASGDVGKYVQYQLDGIWQIAKIITFVSATQVTVEPYENIIDTAHIDTKARITFVSGNLSTLHVPSNSVWTVPAGTTLVGTTLTYPAGGPFSINMTSGTTYSAGGSGWPDRLRSNITIWTAESENSWIKVDDKWYFLGRHYQQLETYNASPGGSLDVDVMEVLHGTYSGGGDVMKAATGVLSFSAHTILATMDSSGAVFTALQDIGRLFRLEFGDQQVFGSIVNVNSTTNVTVLLGRMMPPSPVTSTGSTYLSDAKTTIWRLGSWYAGNYPAIVFFHEERLGFASSLLESMRIWMSKSADFNNMAPTDESSKVTDDSAINVEIASGQINAILWVVSAKVLLIGTAGGEWQTTASTINEALTPTNISFKEMSSYGSAKNVKPWKIGSSVFFVQSDTNSVRELAYSYQDDAFIAHDATIVSEHIAKDWNGIVATAYQRTPTSTFWAITTLGPLIGLTFEKDQEVVAWHRQMIGGYISTGFLETGDPEFNERVTVESIAVVPSADGLKETLYMIVKRFIPGLAEARRYIEYIEAEFDPVKVKNDLIIAAGDPFFTPTTKQIKSEMFFVDCGVTYRGSATNVMSGLAHLKGEYVEIMADGGYRGRFQVTLDSVTFTGAPAEIIHAGLFNRAWVKPLPIESGSPNGTAQGKIKRVQFVIVRLLNTLGLKYGSAVGKLRLASFRKIEGLMDEAPDLFTGDKLLTMSQDYGYDGVFILQQDQPYPVTILAMMPQLSTNT